MFVSLLVALLAPAHAASDIEFKTAGPVLIYVDGAQATLTHKLKQRVEDLAPGTHEIKVTGVFGKTLYEAEIELPDETVTQAEWSGRELKVLSTDWRDAADDEGDEVADDAPPAPIEDEVAAVAPPPADELPLALPADPEPLPAVALPAPSASAAPGKTLTVQAQDGMRVEVVHQGQTVVVIVEDGGFRIEDPAGLRFSLTASR